MGGASTTALNNGAAQTTKDPIVKPNADGSVPSGFILKLYQMCTSAPDDVVSWTEEGDAFRIGSDLNRLESETLPQYFRHSRFQSLVRQLNFYNFRKVNRERTFWIYKHNLFHRDRPEDLHLLRRRTCPGVDGRKNRFVAVGSRKTPNRAVVSRDSSRTTSSDDSSQGEDLSEDENTKRTRQRSSKRPAAVSSRAETKRVRKEVVVEETFLDDDADSNVEHMGQMSDEDEEVPPEKKVRSESVEHSLVVSQVAMKLEEYARKSKKGSSLSSTSRTRGGVVTPPTGSAFGYLAADSRGLLTYDDELASNYKKPSSSGRRVSDESITTQTLSLDRDEAVAVGDEEGSSPFGRVVSEASTPVRPIPGATEFEAPPVQDLEMVKAVLARILSSGNEAGEDNGHVTALAAVIGFCMTTAPCVGDELFSKVFHLLSSTATLATEFQEYRAALYPMAPSIDLLPSFTFTSGCLDYRIVSSQQIWERSVSRGDAVREFKTFAVNYFHKVLLQHYRQNVSFTDVEVDALRNTADAWLRSSCAAS